MEPTSRYPFNVRSFFTNVERKDLRNGIEAWRGYFQSVRPATGRMLINIDISTGIMYKGGPLIGLCLDFFGRIGANANMLAPAHGLPQRQWIELKRFLMGIKIVTTTVAPNRRSPRAVKSISSKGADQMTFQLREGGTLTVAKYFKQTHNRTLQFPSLPCVEVGHSISTRRNSLSC